jgi:hypothetical protein
MSQRSGRSAGGDQNVPPSNNASRTFTPAATQQPTQSSSSLLGSRAAPSRPTSAQATCRLNTTANNKVRRQSLRCFTPHLRMR